MKETFTARVTGQPVERIEDLRLLRGRGQYVDDLHREGMLHAAILRSPVAHGRIRSIDAAAARRLPGVRAVYTAEDVARASGGRIPTIPLRLAPLPELVPFEQPVIALERVRFVGEPMAIVVADSAALAEDALDAITVDIDPLPPLPDRHASARGDVLVHEEHGSNVAITYTATLAGPAPVDPPYVRREKFSVQRHSAVTLEPRGLLAEWNGAATKMTVAGAAKAPFATRRVLARCMDLPEDCVDMLEYDVGGGFGVRGEFYPEDFLVPFSARKLGRPVKWVEDRRENLLASNHARQAEGEVEIACSRDGTILALRGHVWVDIGAYMRGSASIPARVLAQGLSGPYRIPHIGIRADVMLTTKAPAATYRGPGRFEAEFFRERLLDMVAADLGIDRVELRRRNLVSAAEMPYTIATISPFDRTDEFDGGDYGVALDRALAEIGWKDKIATQGKLIDGRYHGLGIACFTEGGGAGPRENTRFLVECDAAGRPRVTLYTGSANVGQGLETICLQIASDALGVPMESIRVLHGSTIHMDEGFGSYHSRSVVMGGSAILDAAAKVKDALRRAAAPLLGCDAEQVRIGPGLDASFGSKSVPLSQLAKDGLSVPGTFGSHHHTFANGAAAAHVAVDAGTGHVEVLQYVVVQDAGRIINPMLSRGQAVGAVVQGLGGTFLEHLQYDSQGQLLTASLADYLLPSATDFPRIRAVLLQDSPSPHNPLGAKGIGEGSIMSVGGVVANAVANALSSFGVQPRQLPLTPDRVWGLVQEAGAR